MENLLSAQFKPFIDLAISILPADVANRLNIFIWQVENYDTLKNVEVPP
jgi:hypothetical protein